MRGQMSSGYRPPSREPRGRWARHIHAERKRQDWSATVAFEKLLEAGYPLGPKSRSAYLPVDEGKRDPKPDEEAALVKVYGYPPEQEETGRSALGEAGIGELVQAVRDQTAAIERQTMALTSILATALGTQNEDARAAVEELVDRLVSPRRDADPVSSGTQ